MISISVFARLSLTLQMDLIRDSALLIESYKDNDDTVTIYFFNSFFIEVTEKVNNVIEIIPFLRGYKIVGN